MVKENKLKLKHKANIFAVYVSPEKRGIGKCLMVKAIKKAKDLDGLEQIYLTVVTTNESEKNSTILWDLRSLEEKKEHLVLFL